MSDDQPDATWSYQRGDWFGIVGPDLTLLLPGSEKSRVTALWELVDGGAGFEQVLDGLLSSGLSGLPGFVLIGSGSGPTRLLLRGSGVRAAVVSGDEPVALEGSTTATWAERVFDGVTSLSVSVGPPDEQARHLPIDQGLVRVSRVDRPAHASPSGASVAPVTPLPVAHQESSPLDDDADADTNAQPAPYADLADAELDEPVTMAFDPLDADPVAEGEEEQAAAEEDEVAPADPVEEHPPPPLQSVGTWTPAGGGPAQSLPPPPPMPPMAPVPVDPDPDHDGMTQIGLDRGDFARQQPGIPGQPQPPSITRPVAKLLVSNGEAVDVDRVVLVGRAPEARRFTATEQPRLVTVPSPLHEVSSTHIEIRPGSGADHGSAVVTDMGSTNGTVLVQPGLGPEELKPGIAVQLIPGAVINLGDGVTIQVARP
jgi:hypothetical protein